MINLCRLFPHEKQPTAKQIVGTRLPSINIYIQKHFNAPTVETVNDMPFVSFFTHYYTSKSHSDATKTLRSNFVSNISVVNGTIIAIWRVKKKMNNNNNEAMRLDDIIPIEWLTNIYIDSIIVFTWARHICVNKWMGQTWMCSKGGGEEETERMTKRMNGNVTIVCVFTDRMNMIHQLYIELFIY